MWDFQIQHRKNRTSSDTQTRRQSEISLVIKLFETHLFTENVHVAVLQDCSHYTTLLKFLLPENQPQSMVTVFSFLFFEGGRESPSQNFRAIRSRVKGEVWVYMFHPLSAKDLEQDF